MQDYTPLSLARYCNVDADFHDRCGLPPLGRHAFHGLPFQFGKARPNKIRAMIGFGGKGGTNEPVKIKVAHHATHLIFAHVLLESDVIQGGPVGECIATYAVVYDDKTTAKLPIRERFEIGSLPHHWGQKPFLALPDGQDMLPPRYEGPFSQAAARQTETMSAWPFAYYLYAWANPHPEREIKKLIIEPGPRKFILGAVTVSHLDEWPFARQAGREVIIELSEPEDAAKPFKLAVKVDRGVATFPYPITQQSRDDFLNSSSKGWGAPANRQSSPAYVKIAATPSATISVEHEDQPLAQANWGQLQSQGQVETPRAKLTLADPGRNWVHTRVVDDDTGKPIPCRVHFRSARGIPYQPHGHHDHVHGNLASWHHDIGGDMKLGDVSYAYIDGRCQGWLPRGEVIVDVARGFEYQPLRQTITIAPGQREVELRLKRWINMNDHRWFSADTHVHFLGTQGAHREAAAEDLNLVHLLASQWGHLFTNAEDFIGRPTASDDGRTIVYCSQENRQHMLGHLSLLGLKQPVMPWCSGGADESEMGGELEVTLSRWADACHAQGGAVVIPHLPAPNGEPAALIAAGKADAVEMLIHNDYNHLEYYRYLNCGYRLPLVGGTDKMSSDVPVGICRTYAYIPDDLPFDFDHWLSAMRAGRTFLSSGPLLALTIDGHLPGDTINLPGNGGKVHVNASARSIFPIHTLQLVVNGQVVEEVTNDRGDQPLQMNVELPVTSHAWVAVRCAGKNYTAAKHHDGWQRGQFAHTSPIYLAVGGPWWMFNIDTARYMLTLIDGSVNHIRHQAHHHAPGSVTHHHHDHDHLRYLEQPLHDAAAAIHRRMHELGIPH